MVGYDDKYLNTYRRVPVFYHQSQVIVKVRGSDYIFNTYRTFFNMLWNAVTKGEVSPKLKGVSIGEWEKGPDRINGRRAYSLVNRRRGLVFYCRSLSGDMPVMFSFMDVGFSVGGVSPLAEKNTVTISKMWDAKDKVVLISFNFVGHPSRYREFLDRIKDVAHREVDFSVGEVKPVRVELYVRYKEEREPEVKTALRGLYRRYGLWLNLRENKHEGYQPDNSVLYVGRVELAIDGLRLHIKSYRRQNYKAPAESIDDHPKVEVSVYFKEGLTFEEVNEQIEKAQSLLASFVYATHLEDSLILDYDTYPKAEANPDPLIIRGIIKGELEEAVKSSLFGKTELGDLDKALLLELSFSNLNSQRLKEFAERNNTPIRTVRYHMRKLERLGMVIKRRVKGNQWVYMLNVDALRGGRKPKAKPDIMAIIERAKEREVIPLEIRHNDRLQTVYLLLLEGYSTSKALSKVMGLSDRQIRYYLAELERLGLVSRDRLGRYVRWKPKPILVNAPLSGEAIMGVRQ